ncbi:hypothetical protein ACLMJK_005962 [Lecanora helva]
MVSTQGKRKKTTDMPDSPPKRVTRARAAKAPEDAPAKPKTTKVTTASSKAAAEKRKAAVLVKAEAPAKTTKRKTRADDEAAKHIEDLEAPTVEEQEPEEEQESKQANAKGRPKKVPAAATKKVEVVDADAPKTRGRSTKATASTTSAKSEAPKPRGRAKKAPESKSEAVEAEEQTEETPPEPAKKSTRGRPAAASQAAANVSKPAPAASKKRVKFEEANDKENIPMEKAGTKKSAMKPTGLNAKPLRKPVVARVTTRGRKAAQPSKTSSEMPMQNEATPLSPKKINQVAKSDPISEDELAGEKTPVRALSMSPAKRPLSPIKDIGSVSRLNFDQHMVPSSPAKEAPTNVLASPARRPPPSPFKDALKASPKRLDLGTSLAQPLLQSSHTPKKGSLLQESPKRGGLSDSVTRPVLLPSKSPQKASLLQSPARRPMGSPTKVFDLGRVSPELMDVQVPTSPTKASPRKVPTFSLETAVSSPFRAAKSPEQRSKVHIMTDEERNADTAEVPSSPIRPREPEKLEDITNFERTAQGSNGRVDTSVVSNDNLFSSAQVESTHDSDNVSEDTDSPQPTGAFLGPAFSIGSSSLHRISMASESSEDELASPQKIYEITPLKRQGISAKDFDTPAVIGSEGVPHSSAADLPFSPLADQLSGWKATSPEKQSRPRQARGMFSLGGERMSPAVEVPTPTVSNVSPAKVSFFEDEMAITNGQDETSFIESAETNDNDSAMFKVSIDSAASEEYGDENAAPTDTKACVSEQEADKTITCTPAKVFTPAKVISRPGEIYTVSKVPLRPSAEESPLNVPRQRSRSLGGPLTTVNQLQVARDEEGLVEQPATPALAASLPPQTPSSGMKLDAETPGRTVRKGVKPDVLKGAVVHVDVHTTEGADASGIFVDLLTQMGARCVKQWHWNPRASFGGSAKGTASPQGGSPDAGASKIGITHVVYKDGGKRTLEKIRSANGEVHGVGVGWVLDCEREDKWLDEADYAIDTSLFPRGGGRRRKSMEPRALANLNGSLVTASDSETSPKSPDMSPTKEFLTFDTPASRRDTFVIEPAQAQVVSDVAAPSTPGGISANDETLEERSAYGSPTTPYYLSKGAKLMQQTCPPKQMAPMGLFPVSGNIEDQPDETVRRRLIEARRKSLQWSSRIRSPLGRTVSYGK